jgi:uncharacterized protein
MKAREIQIDVEGSLVSAAVFGSGATLVALGHGAGGTRRTASLVHLAERLAATGRAVMLFNFPYSEAGRRAPDRAPILEAAVGAVARAAREHLGAERLVLGGRSMGGRIASQAVAAGLGADALLLLAYPLHPPGKPERLRDAHLPRVQQPMLFIQGTRDAFARWDLLEATIQALGPRATLQRIEDGDHSFGVPKRAGRTAAEIDATILNAIEEWLSAQGL